MTSNYKMMHNSRTRTLNDIQTDIINDELLSTKNKHQYLRLIKKSKYIHTLRAGHLLLNRAQNSEARTVFKEACGYAFIPFRALWGLLKTSIS